MSFSDDLKKEEELARRRFVHATRPRGPLSWEQAEALVRRMEGSTESRTKSQHADDKAVDDFTRVYNQVITDPANADKHLDELAKMTGADGAEPDAGPPPAWLKPK